MSGGLSSALTTALSGIAAYEQGISVVGQNLANETTAGYAVESLATTTQANGAGRAGSGVADPALVRRAADSFAAGRVNAAQSASSAATTLSGALSAIDNAFTGSGDVSGAATTFFSDLSTLASEPTSAAQAQTVLADAQGIAAALNSAAGTLNTQRGAIGQSLATEASSANQLLKQLATINQGLLNNPNDSALLDQQQAALTSLSGLVSVSTLPLGGGQVEVVSGGTVLLDQSGAQAIAVQQSGSATPTLTVGAGAQPLRLLASNGALGANLAAYGATASAGGQLDWFATALAAAVNTAQAQGLDGSGKQGQALFSLPAASVVAAGTNTGTASLAATVTNAAALPSDGQGYQLSYGASGWTATAIGSGQTTALGAGPTLTLAGLSIAVSGNAARGDSFTVNPNKGAAAGIAVAASSATAIAAADPYAVTPGTIGASGAVTDNNVGSVSEASDTVTSTPSAGAAVVPGTYFGQTLSVNFTSTSAYTITNAAGTTIASGSYGGSSGTIAIGYPSGSAASGQYWQVSLSGTPAAGDTLTLAPAGSNSGSNATRLAALLTASNSALPGGSLQAAFEQTVAQTATAAQAASKAVTATASNLTSAQDTLTQIAGVDPNAQAVLLEEYQQAFQAASKVVSAEQAMFQSLITAVNA